MYFPIGWPRQLEVLQDRSPLVQICCNQDRLLFCILTENALSLWCCKPIVQIVSIRRSDNSVSKFGINQKARWKPDSSMVAVTTSKGYIIFFKVDVDYNKNGHAILYNQKSDSSRDGRGTFTENHEKEQVPALTLTQQAYIQVIGGVTSLVCLREDLMVATGEGLLLRIKWDGLTNTDLTIHLKHIPFSVDLQHSRASQLDENETYIKCFQYSPLLGGFAAVLSTGKAAFITANTLKFEPDQVVGVWAQEVSQATCVAINDRYTLMAFGCKSGEGIVYHLDELTGALVISHKLVVSSKDFPDAMAVCGSVSDIKWTPEGSALIMSWSKGGFALWSVYGALLLHSMGVQAGSFSEDMSRHPLLLLKSMEWGSEGYHLWTVSERPSAAVDLVVEAVSFPHLLVLNFAKSALTINPCVSNHEHVFLQSEDKLYLCSEETMPSLSSAGSADGRAASEAATAFTGNKQWQIVPIPHAYLAHNWPIKYTTVSSSGHCLAVAGKTGLAHYAFFSRKWKLFGNETQERDMMVTGGLVWWKDFICAACFNLLDQRDEIRFYPRDSKLDNTFAHSVRVPSQVVLLNVFRDILIVLCADSHIMIFNMERKNGPQYPSLVLSKLQEVAVGNFITHPSTVITITMTSIRTDAANVKSQPQPYEAESIIVNVAGRLLMFQRDRSGLQPKPRDSPHKQERPLPFYSPVMVASNVESMWYCMHKNARKPHLTEALWLSCGAAGVKVWLPLFPKDVETGAKSRGFMSRRIMLPFHINIYPLAVLFEAGILLGAASDSLCYQSVNAVEEGWPYLQLDRTNQVYLHQILRQLLRRNLGVHALEMAHTCTDLPYFGHTLELLVHEVLEEEATSKEPIPDPLLPRVVAFVEEFPEYLQTVVHCARKTEVALWPYLFATVGNPKDLFEKCLISGALTTASSYLIILQNLEKPMVARQHATLLLDAALEACQWDMARDLLRFLKAIDPSDVDSPRASTKTRGISNNSMYPVAYPTTPSPISPGDANTFVYPGAGGNRARSMSLTKEDMKESGKERQKNRASGDSANSRKSPSSIREDGADQFYIDVILSRHARKLLSSYRLRDLAFFAANLEDYQLVSWLRKERLRAARVEDFVAATKKVHEDFAWPLPMMRLRDAMPGTLSMPSLSRPTDSLLDLQLNGELAAAAALRSSDSFSNVYLRRSSSYMSSSSTVGTSNSDVQLQPQISISTLSDDGSQPATSETGSAAGDTADSAGSGGWNEAVCMYELEMLSMELANKGPAEVEHQLRYLYQMVLEASCLEWGLIIGVVLRDAMSVVRVVNTASMVDTPIEVVGRMREGLSYLQMWADTECLGYKSFMLAIQGQAKQLEKIVEQNLTTSRMNYPTNVAPRTKRISTSSEAADGAGINEEAGVEGDDEPGERDDDAGGGECEELEQEQQDEEQGYECVLS